MFEWLSLSLSCPLFLGCSTALCIWPALVMGLCSLGQRPSSIRDTGSHHHEEWHCTAVPVGSALSSSLAYLSLPSTSSTTTEAIFYKVCKSSFASGSLSQSLHPETGHASLLVKRQMHKPCWRGREGRGSEVTMWAGGWEAHSLHKGQGCLLSFLPILCRLQKLALHNSQDIHANYYNSSLHRKRLWRGCLRVTDEADVKNSVIGCQYPITLR